MTPGIPLHAPNRLAQNLTKKELRISDHSSEAGLYYIKFAYYEYDSAAIKEANENDLRVWIELGATIPHYQCTSLHTLDQRREIQTQLKKSIALYYKNDSNLLSSIDAFFDLRTTWIPRDVARLIWRFFAQRGWEEKTILA